jgi:hypothetical protein
MFFPPLVCVQLDLNNIIFIPLVRMVHAAKHLARFGLTCRYEFRENESLIRQVILSHRHMLRGLTLAEARD